MKDDVLKIKAALQEKIKTIQGASLLALYKAGLEVEEAAFDKTPKDTGNLRDSFYTDFIKGGVQVGNTAEYAVSVHEDLTARHPVGEAKYLEKAVNEKEARVLEILTESARKAI